MMAFLLSLVSTVAIAIASQTSTTLSVCGSVWGCVLLSDTDPSAESDCSIKIKVFGAFRDRLDDSLIQEIVQLLTY